MRLYLQFILRYFRYGKKRNFASNAISLATIGLAIGVFSLLVTISVIKGFESILSSKLINVDGKVRLKTIFGTHINTLDRLDKALDVYIAKEYVSRGLKERKKQKEERDFLNGLFFNTKIFSTTFNERAFPPSP